MSKSKTKKAGNFIVYALLLLLMVGLAGFGITNLIGGGSNLGSVGDRDITSNE